MAMIIASLFLVREGVGRWTRRVESVRGDSKYSYMKPLNIQFPTWVLIVGFIAFLSVTMLIVSIVFNLAPYFLR